MVWIQWMKKCWYQAFRFCRNYCTSILEKRWSFWLMSMMSLWIRLFRMAFTERWCHWSEVFSEWRWRPMIVYSLRFWQVVCGFLRKASLQVLIILRFYQSWMISMMRVLDLQMLRSKKYWMITILKIII